MTLPKYFMRARELLEGGDPAAAYKEMEKSHIKDYPKSEAWRHYDTLGVINWELGRVKEALDCFKRAAYTKGNPCAPQLMSNYLMMLHYLPNADDEFISHEHFLYDSFLRGVKRFSHLPRKREKLRIGYIAVRFSTHVVINFAIQLFACHDRSRFEVFCYDISDFENETTEQLKTLVDGWCNVSKLSIEEAAKKIYEDEIDILVDLSGHTEGGQTLLVDAYKPAPITVSTIGYFDTTGLKAMDYYFGDAYVDDDAAVSLFSEEVIRLPHTHLCYTPSEEAHFTEPLYSPKDYITFGSFNNFAKITDEVLTVWREILGRVPNSKLLLKNPRQGKRQSKTILERALTLGFTESDIEIREYSVPYLHEYNKIDIALDTFPYPGGGTTCEALFMGVPVISRYGRRHGSRFGLGILSNCGLEGLAVSTNEDYIERAIGLANDRELLTMLHQNLRDMMKRSPLMDGRGYTKEVETAYEMMWENWREQSQKSTS